MSIFDLFRIFIRQIIIWIRMKLRQIQRWLCELLCSGQCHGKCDDANELFPHWESGGFAWEGDFMVTMKVGQKVEGTLTYRDAAGNVRAPEGDPVLSFDNAGIVDVTVVGAGQAGVYTVTGTALAVGACVCTLTADGDKTPGVKPILTIAEFSVFETDVATGELVFGTPTDPV